MRRYGIQRQNRQDRRRKIRTVWPNCLIVHQDGGFVLKSDSSQDSSALSEVCDTRNQAWWSAWLQCRLNKYFLIYKLHLDLVLVFDFKTKSHKVVSISEIDSSDRYQTTETFKKFTYEKCPSWAAVSFNVTTYERNGRNYMNHIISIIDERCLGLWSVRYKGGTVTFVFDNESDALMIKVAV